MKRTTRTKVNLGALYVLFLVLVVAVVLVTDWPAIKENFLDPEVAKDQFPDVITTAAKNTVFYTVMAFIGGLIGGLILALMKLSPVLPYRWVATAYIEIFRGLPALLVIYGFAFAVPIAFDWNPQPRYILPILGLIVVSAAYIAETIRAGIEAVPKGQMEAARSLGMRPSWTMISVTLPQAIRIVIPPMTNEVVVLIKDTALLFIAGFALQDRELTTFARDAVSSTSNSTALVIAGAMYLVVTIPLTQLVAYMERRMRRSR
ncbi:MAG: amino acid ABC transporter permease [Actinomycetia bacterium]|nr:amino acid ABC transporter permease [Actinomycetes bacterium]